MSNHKDSLVKVLEYLVNEEREKASDLLHTIFVEKAKDQWAAITESDEIVEDDIQEEDLDETIDIDEEEVEESIDAFDAEDDFLNDIESAEDEIDSEEIYDDEDMDDEDAVMDLSVDMGDEGEGEETADAEEALGNVEDAIAELRAAFADLMGHEEGEDEGEDDDMDMEPEMEPEMEGLGEGAELKAVNVTMSGDEDGKASPVKDAGNEHDVKPHPTDTTVESGGKAPAAKDMGVRGPQEAGDLSAAPKPQTREKK